MKWDFKKMGDSLHVTRIMGPIENYISSIDYSSKDVKDFSAFFCIVGEESNGHDFIGEALLHGASVIIGDDVKSLENWSATYKGVTFLVVDNVKICMASMSALFYQEVHKKMKSIAVTGTNGKTTVTSYVHSILNEIGISTGSIGTEGIYNDEEKMAVPPTTPTTPESPDLHEFYYSLYEQGIEAYVMEATSIAIEQGRVEGIDFDIGVHTNLTPEHLEFHGSFSAYKQAKLKLFDQVHKAVINLDDAGMSSELLATHTGPVLTYSLKNDKADIFASCIKPGNDGFSFVLSIQGKDYHLKVSLYGEYNISNLLATIGVCLHLNIAIEKILRAVSAIKGPEGRFQILSDYTDYRIVLDYAHTPDALGKILEAVKTIDHNRLIVMITGIGLRNPEKRPLMAKEVEGKADEVVVTVDHPGFFDRREIVKDVLEGFAEADAEWIHSELHREKGIHKAISLAGKNDLVLLTGIGFGGYQVIEGKKEYYSELEVIDNYFEKIKKRNQ